MLGIKPCKWFQWDINATWSKNRIKNFVENIPIYDGWNLLDVVSVSHKSTRIAFSPDFLLNNRFAFTYQGFEAALQSQFVGKQYMTNAEVEALTLDKYFVSNLNLAYTFKPRKVVKEVTMGVTVYNLFNEEYENNGWASSSYDKDVNHRIDSAGYAAQAVQMLWPMSLSVFNNNYSNRQARSRQHGTRLLISSFSLPYIWKEAPQTVQRTAYGRKSSNHTLPFPPLLSDCYIARS